MSAPLYKAVAVVARERAADLAALLELVPFPSPVAVLTAEVPGEPEITVEALYADRPDAEELSRLAGLPVRVEDLPDQDWIRLSQQGLPPVRAGRFFVYGAHDRGTVPLGVIPLAIDAGLAFGTGHHETTALCLEALSDLARVRRPRTILDVGTGTGVLAIAAARLWRRMIVATDIDPVAIETARANARDNGALPFLQLGVADGLETPLIRNRGPYDLVIANILAGPLTRLSGAIAAATAPGGHVLLSGLLRHQEQTVTGFYRARGLTAVRRLRQNAWSALLFRR